MLNAGNSVQVILRPAGSLQ